MASMTAERVRGSETEMALLASIVDSSHDAIVGKTLDGIIMTWNHAAEKMYGYAASEVVGESITRVRRSKVRCMAGERPTI